MSSPDPLITIFTSPKPFTNPHVSLIQGNAIRSWQHLGDEVNVLMIGDEPGMAEFAAEVGIQCLPEVTRNPLGTPLVNSIFQLARQYSTSPLLAYVNADILLMPQFINVATQVYCQVKKFLIVGQRYNLSLQEPLDFKPGWDLYLLSDLQIRGRLHPPAGSDYFIFPRDCFTDLPKFAIGRAGWDNWMFTFLSLMQHHRSSPFIRITIIRTFPMVSHTIAFPNLQKIYAWLVAGGLSLTSRMLIIMSRMDNLCASLCVYESSCAK
jgi:hypothetical protein